AVSEDLGKTIRGNLTRVEITQKNSEQKKQGRIRKAIQKAELEEAKQARQERLEKAASAYYEEKAKNEILEKQVETLTRQLSVRRFVQNKGFQTAKCSEAHKEFLASKLPTAVMTISP
uniref:Uncharacterized protein n=1 Tax=Clytia hemisphaerica TaxID=252671 RepID=A0A7M5XJL6_9CNID